MTIQFIKNLEDSGWGDEEIIREIEIKLGLSEEQAGKFLRDLRKMSAEASENQEAIFFAEKLHLMLMEPLKFPSSPTWTELVNDVNIRVGQLARYIEFKAANLPK